MATDSSEVASGPDQSPAPDRTPDRQRVLLVTGVLGAGKTTALRALEDLGWEVIDNFPIRMLERLIDSPDGHPAEAEVHAPLAIFGCMKPLEVLSRFFQSCARLTNCV